MKSSIKILCALALLAAAFFPARAASPEYLNYQGLLNGADGQPLPTGNYTMEFNIHDQATGGAKQWGPFLFDGGAGNGHGPLVPVANGRFNVIIGPLDTASRAVSAAFISGNRFIEIKVNGGSPILPRQQFLSTPYAFKANTADQATSASVASSVSDVNVALRNTANTFTANQTVNGTAIVNGSVTATGNVTVGGKGVAVGEENLRIVRGSVQSRTDNGPCTILAGTGFQAQRETGGRYLVTISSPFAGIPTITANSHTYDVHCSITQQNTNSFLVQLVQTTVSARDSSFSFIAIGPR